MDYLREVLRGAVATIAASAVMGLLGAVALAWLHAPVTWPFIATVMAAALGGPAALTGSLDAGRMTAAVHGSVGVLPLGLAVPGALVFAAVLVGSLRTRPGIVAVRAAGAAVALTALLVAVLTAGPGRLRLDLPVAGTGSTREALVVARPEAGATVLGAVVAFGLLTGFGVALVRLPYAGIVARTALLGLTAPVLAGLLAALVVAPQRPAIAGVAVLFGADAVLAAVLSGFGAGPPAVLGGPLATKLRGGDGGHAWLLGDSAGPVVVRMAALAAFLVLGAALLATVRPDAGTGRRPRAATRAAVAGGTLAVVLAATTAAAAGAVRLGVTVLFFDAQVLSLRVAPAVGWALLAGAVAGGLAGLVGSLVADVRARPVRGRAGLPPAAVERR